MHWSGAPGGAKEVFFVADSSIVRSQLVASAEILSERAARLGVSPHELARHYVVEALVASEELAAIGTAVNALLQEMQGVRQDLALSVEALLASAGEVSEKQAHSWVEASLNRH